ncbi:MAG: hypothetical protein EOP58_07070, partial [Sphingomonadales bacterium]
MTARMMGLSALALMAAAGGVAFAPASTAAPQAATLPEEMAGFTLDFVVLHRADNPGLATRAAGIAKVNYNVETWKAFDPAKADLRDTKRDVASQGDGFDDRILDGKAGQRSANYFNSGEQIRLSPTRVTRTGNVVTAEYPADPRFTLTATADLSAKPYPLVKWTLTAKTPGYYSV